jgi:hypothetical protein
MMWQRLVGYAVVAAIALAGCADKGAGAEGSDAATDGSAPAPDGSGSLVGLVVDDAVRPLADANVTATGPSGTRTTLSDAGGMFRFDGLAPGVYLVDVSKPFYIAHRQAVTVVEGVEPEAARFQLTFEAASVPYANVYKLEGFYECGLYTLRVCSNVNIATWVVLCAQTGGQVCIGNVTQDHSLFFQWVEPGLDFIQTEMAWSPTTATGTAMSLLIGGGSEAELKEGVSLPAYNGTSGESPLMLRVSNHEGPDNWCARETGNEDCNSPDVLNRSKIGTERALLIQVDTGPTFPVMESCGVPGPYDPHPCGAGVSAQQPYTLFTITFYGYEPPVDWLFATTGEVPPPPV